MTNSREHEDWPDLDGSLVQWEDFLEKQLDEKLGSGKSTARTTRLLIELDRGINENRGIIKSLSEFQGTVSFLQTADSWVRFIQESLSLSRDGQIGADDDVLSHINGCLSQLKARLNILRLECDVLPGVHRSILSFLNQIEYKGAWSDAHLCNAIDGISRIATTDSLSLIEMHRDYAAWWRIMRIEESNNERMLRMMAEDAMVACLLARGLGALIDDAERISLVRGALLRNLSAFRRRDETIAGNSENHVNETIGLLGSMQRCPMSLLTILREATSTLSFGSQEVAGSVVPSVAGLSLKMTTDFVQLWEMVEQNRHSDRSELSPRDRLRVCNEMMSRMIETNHQQLRVFHALLRQWNCLEDMPEHLRGDVAVFNLETDGQILRRDSTATTNSGPHFGRVREARSHEAPRAMSSRD